jgi:hypothetical protein
VLRCALCAMCMQCDTRCVMYVISSDMQLDELCVICSVYAMCPVRYDVCDV